MSDISNIINQEKIQKSRKSWKARLLEGIAYAAISAFGIAGCRGSDNKNTNPPVYFNNEQEVIDYLVSEYESQGFTVETDQLAQIPDGQGGYFSVKWDVYAHKDSPFEEHYVEVDTPADGLTEQEEAYVENRQGIPPYTHCIDVDEDSGTGDDQFPITKSYVDSAVGFTGASGGQYPAPKQEPEKELVF